MVLITSNKSGIAWAFYRALLSVEEAHDLVIGDVFLDGGSNIILGSTPELGTSFLASSASISVKYWTCIVTFNSRSSELPAVIAGRILSL